ncbi:hypothetical protein VCHA53O466_50201 [Vibrio chagasii]|nr:hypothetical protein VCHA53O466_50201 [Vibrio chagasii]
MHIFKQLHNFLLLKLIIKNLILKVAINNVLGTNQQNPPLTLSAIMVLS